MKKIKRLIILLLAVIAGVFLLRAPEVQELYWDWYFDRNRGTDVELLVKTYAAAHGVRYADYPESLIELLERNPETRTFVLEYPTWEPVDYDLSEYGELEGVPLFLQWDQRWGYTEYGSDVLGITGCGPTCLAMVGYYITGDEWFTPENVAVFADKNGYYVPGWGSSWTLISEGGEELGLDVTEIPLVKQRILNNLEVGNPIILALGPGDFTSTGHYVVIVGLEDGKFQIHDPNSMENSGKLWSYEQLEAQIRNLWVIREGRGRGATP